MAVIMDADGTAFQTKSGGELNWLENGQVTVNLLNGTVLSAIRDAVSGEVLFTSAPAGSQTDHEKAWPHPAGMKPPKFLSYWPDDPTKNGRWVGYQP